MLKVFLIGYGELASSLMLGVLESSHKLVGVLNWEKTQEKFFYSAIKDYFYPSSINLLTKTYKIPKLNVKSVNSKEFLEQASKLKPDIILIGAWGEILKKEIIVLPKIACINCHPSLLPKHRGSNPYSSVIREDETKTGISFHLIDENIDSGPILLQKEIYISDNDTGGSLKKKCAYKAKESVKELLDGVKNAKLLPQKQDKSKMSYFPRIKEEDAKINWNKPSKFIHNQIRALNPWLKCYTRYKNLFLQIGTSKIIELKNPVYKPGEILAKYNKGFIVSTSDTKKALLIDDLESFGFVSKLWSSYFIDKSVKIGDYMEDVG
ncbi:MAG: methionyl-tRNA formyltransferase [bacterium]